MTAKRSFEQQQQEPDDEEDVIDDLAVAAQFAMAQPVLVIPALLENDDNEIDLASSSGDEGSSASAKMKTEKPNAKFDDDDEDDVEGSVTAEEQAAQNLALEKMLEGLDSDGEDDAESAQKERRRPLSKNEIDVYEANLNEVQKILNWNLEIGNLQLPADPSSWAIAGHVQQHVVSERTIVILSQLGGALLEEGTLLALRLDADAKIEEKRLPRQIPLGKILEVFGPVSRPLYSLRLTVFNNSSATMVGPSAGESTGTDAQLEDPWGDEGLFTAYVKEHSNLPVYFLPKGSAVTTKILDPVQVYKNSGKGCDASNLYDEEIDQKEMEYSDDEQERRAKANRKTNKRSDRTSWTGSPSFVPTTIPRGFHQGHTTSPHSRTTQSLSQYLPGLAPAPNATVVTRNLPTNHAQEDESDTEYYDFT